MIAADRTVAPSPDVADTRTDAADAALQPAGEAHLPRIGGRSENPDRPAPALADEGSQIRIENCMDYGIPLISWPP